LGIRFKNGALGNIFISFCVGDGQDHRRMLTLNFERGTIYLKVAAGNTPSPETTADLLLFRDSPRRWQPLIERSLLPETDPYHWEAFYNAIHGQDIADDHYRERIVAGIKVIEAMARAEKSGKVEKV
jgi:predicted dehydrogenase